jgi:hypothetical protein
MTNLSKKEKGVDSSVDSLEILKILFEILFLVFLESHLKNLSEEVPAYSEVAYF